MDKTFEPISYEGKITKFWLENDFFKADSSSSKKPYTIVIPPPNVTGVLHMGHALTLTIEDILIRWKRMSGFEALYLPGTDHAGIATQMVTERKLKKEEGKSRHDIGREKFLEKVWEVKDLHHGVITDQMKRIGASVDWSRERFTMDEGFTKGVREVFVRLYEEGLIYRDTRMINWCSRCYTALSDLEVVNKNRKGKLWQIKYPIAGTDQFITIATTRPETLLGDSAVAVHPEDERYKDFVGKELDLPLTDRKIKIISDEYVDREFGTGALKITPAHDFNDYEIGKRHKLAEMDVMTKDGKMADNAGAYAGLEILEARKKILSDLEEKGLLLSEDDHAMSVGLCDRCDTIVEPKISMQWFVEIEPLARPALEAVKTGKIKITPKHFEKTYYAWMENIRDWTISRQLWWGHQIPAWHCQNCSEIIVARSAPDKCTKCDSSDLKQDEDVLDTWFSSGLWPFGTLGWPEETPDLKKFYPGSVLETGQDIIFFWVARMIMFGIHFMKEIPFSDVYFHAMVRDEHGKKMSKTRGNVIDPLGVIDDVGADALRFTLASLSGQSQNISLSISAVEANKNFINKLWNASRFTLQNIEEFGSGIDFSKPLDAKSLSDVDQWILTNLQVTSKKVNEALEAFRFSEASSLIYHFTWDTFCSWYLEFSKEAVYGDDAKRKEAALLTLNHVLTEVLRMLHPFAPFVTEEIYQMLPHKPVAAITIDEYPNHDQNLVFDEVTQNIEEARKIIDLVRSFRGTNGISPKEKFQLDLAVDQAHNAENIIAKKGMIEALANLSKLEIKQGKFTNEDKKGKLKRALSSSSEVLFPIEGLIDVDAQKGKIEKQLSKITKDHEKLEKKLSNPKFIENASSDVVDKVKEEKAELQDQAGKLQTTLDDLNQL